MCIYRVVHFQSRSVTVSVASRSCSTVFLSFPEDPSGLSISASSFSAHRLEMSTQHGSQWAVFLPQVRIQLGQRDRVA